ncbi:hypothetical protein JCM11251_004242 [Rhodosporidiobolus azoricus]
MCTNDPYPPATWSTSTCKPAKGNAGLLLLRPPGNPTFFGSSGEIATLNLALGNLLADEMLVSAQIDDESKSGSDHRPLRISLLLDRALLHPPPARHLHRKDTARAPPLTA